MRWLASLGMLILVTVPISAKPKPKAPCAIFFQIGQNDARTSGQTLWGMTDQQGHWWIGYEDHGKGNGWFRGHEDNGKYTGICFLRGEMPTMATEIPKYAPVYSIVWGYRSYDSLYQGTTVKHLFVGGSVSVWDYSANNGNGAFVLPVQLTEREHGIAYLGDEGVDFLKQALQGIIDAQKTVNKSKEPWQH